MSQSRKQISDDSSKSGCCVCLPLMDFPSEFHLKFHIFDVQFPCTADWDLQQSCVKGPEGFSYTDCETLLSEAKISLPLEECDALPISSLCLPRDFASSGPKNASIQHKCIPTASDNAGTQTRPNIATNPAEGLMLGDSTFQSPQCS